MVQGPGIAPQGRFISFRTLLVVRYALAFLILLGGVMLVFYYIVTPSIVTEIQGAVAGALQRSDAGLDAATIQSITSDFGEGYFGTVRRDIRQKVLITSFVFFLVSLGMLWLTSTLAVRSATTLTEAARAIARGEYKQDLSALYTGPIRTELSILAEAVEESGRAHIREQALIQRVRELEIQIDEKKAAQQVSEIVETEFFQDLQTKASSMRRRRAERAPNGAAGE